MIKILQQDTVIKPFRSSDSDLNNFLLNDAKKYASALLATTYLIENSKETIAYFSLLNDRVLMNDEEKTVWNRLNRLISNNKRRKSYPAVKIGRLAIGEKYAGKGIGREIIILIARMFATEQQKAGCRFITVEAYDSALGFYEKMGFQFITNKDARQKTRVMYFDLFQVNYQ